MIFWGQSPSEHFTSYEITFSKSVASYIVRNIFFTYIFSCGCCKVGRSSYSVIKDIKSDSEEMHTYWVGRNQVYAGREFPFFFVLKLLQLQKKNIAHNSNIAQKSKVFLQDFSMPAEKSHYFRNRVEPQKSKTSIFIAQFVQIPMLLNHAQPKRVSLLLGWMSQQAHHHNPRTWKTVSSEQTSHLKCVASFSRPLRSKSCKNIQGYGRC